MRKALPIMIQGTHSDAGKSIITTSLCRIFSQDGLKTAPYKSQNMALNSYITPDGKEIGRSQGVQAEAAGIVATTDMNPILIKPTGESRSQIVVHGKPYQNMNASSYRQDFFETGLKIVKESYDRLSEQFERIVIEGAGSPAEINLNDREIVNMRVAQMANSPVILVGDIEKGGVFASLVGTLELLSKEERERVIGVIINKFRGDVSLLEPGLTWFENYTGKKVIGVVPYVRGLHIDAEDSVVLNQYSSKRTEGKELDIAVIRYPMISNFTDIDPFFVESDCDVRFISEVSELGSPDLIILPGSKNTIDDLQFLKTTGIFQKIKELQCTKNVHIFGICGGYQMLGQNIADPDGIESSLKSIEGLSFFQGTTTITTDKTTILSEGKLIYSEKSYNVKGYEIHMGQTTHNNKPLIQLDHHVDGVVSHCGKVVGTYFHGIFHNDKFRHDLLNNLRKAKELDPLNDRIYYEDLRQRSFDLLADHVRSSIDLDYIDQKMKEFQKVNQELERK